MNSIMLKKIGVVSFWVILALLFAALVIALLLYFYPKTIASLQSANPQPKDFDESVTAIETKQNEDKLRSDVREECLPIAKLHDKKTDKAVVMLHGISACPEQFDALADTFFEAGYNVYIPRVPHHGLEDNRRHAHITLDEIGSFLEETASIMSGLGDDVGAVGLSGGANMATWLVQRTDVFKRALLLSPFYEPSLRYVPKWKVPFMMTLYGRDMLPNYFNGELAVNAVAKYTLLGKNYDPELRAPQLDHIAVVTSELDDDIDLSLAHTTARQLHTVNDTTFAETRLTRDFGVQHDIVHPDAPGVSKHQEQLYQLYFDMYENTKPKADEE